MPRPSWLKEEESTRKKSGKLKKKMPKSLKSGRTTVNSGATFRQNDITTDEIEIEHKYTEKSQYTLKIQELEKLRRRCKTNKVPVFVIEFIELNKKFAVVPLDDILKL